MTPEGGPRVVAEVDRRLATAMREAGLPDSTAERAETGLWSDFRSPLALPKMELVAVLERHGADDLVNRVKKGEFDG